ncbi:hypothetical protein [Mesorhizobium sp. ANAO-SY3R2]|uniref:hypothetical protein n=1 Tax=Mesorhizobium sp. ANAO-SY3R2 TaxID=3166644 RepID=UPI00366C9206
MLRASRQSTAIAGNLMLAPMVIAMRLPLIAMEANGDSILRGEGLTAVTEKATALAEGVFAAQMAYFRSAMLFWPEILSGHMPSMLNGAAVQRSATAALRPAGRRVKANFRRLATKAGGKLG